LGLGSWPVLRLRNWSLHLLGTRLRHWLRGWAVLGLRRRPRLRLRRGTVLGLSRTVLRLLVAVLGLLGLLGLDGARLRLLRLSGANLGLIWPVVRLFRPELRLAGAVVGMYGLAGTDFGLTGSYVRLTGAGWLYLRPVVWFAWAIALLARTDSGLTGAAVGLAGPVGHGSRICSRVGAREAWLRRDWPGGCDHGWAASVDVVELLTVLCSFTLMLDLGGHGRNSWATHGFDLGLPRSVSDAASASVVGDAGVVVDDDWALVDVANTGADAVNSAVVVEVVAAPIAAVIANAGVAKAVVDAPVKADVGTPEPAVEAPAVAIPAPVAGGPEGAIVGWSAPGAGDPVVPGGSPVPVAGGPDIVGRGGFWLLIDGQRRRGLVGVFDGRSFAFFVELLGGLRVLIGLVLIGRGRSGLL
jgi:hypothetical protein